MEASAIFQILTFICLVNFSFLEAAATHVFNLDKIHAEYQNGDFDKVIYELEGFIKSGKKCSQSDSIFMEKYLAVVYASNPATRERGRYHMYKLLDITPVADMLDMFVGDEVNGVFEKVCKEHALAAALNSKAKPKTLPRMDPVATAASPAKPLMLTRVTTPLKTRNPELANTENLEQAISLSSTNAEAAAEMESSTNSGWTNAPVWIGGGAAVALVAISLYFADQPKAPAGKTYLVPKVVSN